MIPNGQLLNSHVLFNKFIVECITNPFVPRYKIIRFQFIRQTKSNHCWIFLFIIHLFQLFNTHDTWIIFNFFKFLNLTLLKPPVMTNNIDYSSKEIISESLLLSSHRLFTISSFTNEGSKILFHVLIIIESGILSTVIILFVSDKFSKTVLHVIFRIVLVVDFTSSSLSPFSKADT